MTIVTATATLTATERLARYRSHHRIEVDHSAQWDTCDTDGIRVYQVITRRWQHDPDEIKRLERLAAGELPTLPECYRCHRSIPKGSEEDFLATSVNLGGRLALKCFRCADKDVVIEDHDGYVVTADLP